MSSSSALSPEITTEIVQQADVKDVRQLARDLSERFGQMITVAMVRQVLSTTKRHEQITNAKARASEGLEGALDRTESVSAELEEMWRDASLTPKDRIAAVKELRQWTQMGVHMSGIQDEESGVVFALSAEWSTQSEPSEESNA